MYLAETRKDALEACDQFLTHYEAKFPRACLCLQDHKNNLFAVYDFPAEHWVHLRTTNPIESTFDIVRLRSVRTKACGSRTATLTMVYKLAQQAEKHWRRLNKPQAIPLVVQEVRFIDRMMENAAQETFGSMRSSTTHPQLSTTPR